MQMSHLQICVSISYASNYLPNPTPSTEIPEPYCLLHTSNLFHSYLFHFTSASSFFFFFFLRVSNLTVVLALNFSEPCLEPK